MHHTNQIEPTIKTEIKRTSLYTYIRSAHKMIKMRTEIRKHRTLPNDAYLKEKCLVEYNVKNDVKVDPTPQLHHVHTNSLSPPPSWSWRHQRQLALPPRVALESTPPTSLHTTEEEEYDLYHQDEFESSDDNEDFEEEQDVMDNYTLTLQKLSGITSVDRPKKNTAVLITLSPCALAAANAARQRRQRVRINH